MKLIFLDFEGVITSMHYYLHGHKGRLYDNVFFSVYDPDAIDLVNTIIEQTGAKIVLISDKCVYNKKGRLPNLLKKIGIYGDLYCNLPCKYTTTQPPSINDKLYSIQNLVKSIDDENLTYCILSSSEPVNPVMNLIKTSYITGITSKDVEEAINILNC